MINQFLGKQTKVTYLKECNVVAVENVKFPETLKRKCQTRMLWGMRDMS